MLCDQIMNHINMLIDNVTISSVASGGAGGAADPLAV